MILKLLQARLVALQLGNAACVLEHPGRFLHPTHLNLNLATRNSHWFLKRIGLILPYAVTNSLGPLTFACS